jgi:hypothetical protein
VTLPRPAPQTFAAFAVLALLAAIAAVTSHTDAPAYASYASTDYAAGGYRAWAALLEHEGIATARFVLRPIELDDRIDTLVSAQPVPQLTDPAARTPADLVALAAWVRRGGQLVYAGRNAGLAREEKTALALPSVLPARGARGKLDGPDAGIVVRYPLGRGLVVAVSDALPFTNANIARADNARLAYLVGRPRRLGGVVAFDDGLHGALIDRPWYRALPVPVRVSLAIGAVTLVLGLIGSALRGGAPLALEPPREPSSAEFIAALAALHERIGARAAVRDVLVHDALAAAATSVGLPAGSAAGDALRRLGAARDAPVETDAELLARAKLAHTIRKDIGNDGNGDGRRAAFAGRTRTRRRW